MMQAPTERNSDIMARATDLAVTYHPTAALKSFGIFLENLFFGTFHVLGWVIGRSWFHAARTLFVVGLAFQHGYKQGARVPDPEPEPVEPVRGPSPIPPDGELTPPLGEMRQYAPNVLAYTEPG